MGKMIVQLMNVRLAGAPTFIPGDNPQRHHCMITAINNRGKNRTTGVEMTDEVTLNFWGKYAQTAALFLGKGREINVSGELRSHTIDTGQVRADGKKILHRRNEVLVDQFFFGADSFKELCARINTNLAKAKAEGRLDPNATVTAEELLNITRGTSYDYNPTMAEQTGMYGNAKVYIKGRGFINPSTTGPATANVNANPQVAALEQRIVEMKAAIANGSNTGTDTEAGVDVFAGA